MFFFDKDGNPIYLYRFITYEQEFWMASTKKYTEEELRAIIEPIEKQYDRDYAVYREKCNELFAKKEASLFRPVDRVGAKSSALDIPYTGFQFISLYYREPVRRIDDKLYPPDRRERID